MSLAASLNLLRLPFPAEGIPGTEATDEQTESGILQGRVERLICGAPAEGALHVGAKNDAFGIIFVEVRHLLMDLVGIVRAPGSMQSWLQIRRVPLGIAASLARVRLVRSASFSASSRARSASSSSPGLSARRRRRLSRYRRSPAFIRCAISRMIRSCSSGVGKRSEWTISPSARMRSTTSSSASDQT